MWLSQEGAVYDAYTLDRWSEPGRSDEMQQQTPSAIGAPYDKVTSVGTNMKQIISGPDGNMKATFTGKKKGGNRNTATCTRSCYHCYYHYYYY